MNLIGLALLAMLEGSGKAPSLTTTLPGGTWEVSGALGAAELGTAVPGLGWEAGVAVGITDNLQLNLIWPAVVLRAGSDSGSEYLLGLGTWGVHSSTRFAALTYELGAALGVRTWYGRAVAVALTLEASNTRPWGYTPLTPFFTATAAAGLTVALSEQVTVHLAFAASNTSDVLSNFWQTAPQLGLGSVQQLGFRRLPLVEVHLLPMLSIDALAGAWAPFPYQGSIAVEALLGATVQLP